MFKKRLYLLLFCTIILGIFSGCSSSGSTLYLHSPRDTVNTFLKDLAKGNIDDILQYCDEDSSAYNYFNEITETKLVDKFATSFASEPENQDFFRNSKYIKDCFNVLLKNMYKDYQIIEYSENDDTAEYNISISRIDDESIEFFFSTIFYNLFYDFYIENKDLVDSMVENDNFEDNIESIFVEMFKDMGKDVYDEYVNQIEHDAIYSNRSYLIKLSKKESDWKITYFDVP